MSGSGLPGGGSVFHNDSDCPAPDEGQAIARGEGLHTHDKIQVAWSTVMIERRACRTCCR